MKLDVEKRFDAELKKVFAENLNVLNWLLTHERKHLCIDNLVKEIRKAERRKFSLILDVKIYQMLIEDYAKIFAKAAIKYHEEQHFSENERKRIETEYDALKHANEHIGELEREAFRGATEIEKDKIKKIRPDLATD